MVENWAKVSCHMSLGEDCVTSRELEKKLKQRTTKNNLVKKNWTETEKGNLSILY